jgi:hypothetical protein
MMRPKAIFIVGLGLALAGCGGGSPPPPASSSPDAPQEVPMPSPAAPTSEMRTIAAPRIVLHDIATDDTDKASESDGEPSIAVNPRDPNEIAVVAFSGNWGPDGGPAAPVWKSFDGGKTWEKLPLIPPPARITLGPPQNRPVVLMGPADQNVAYDSEGRLIVAEMGSDRDEPNLTMTVIYQQTGDGRAPLSPLIAFGNGLVDQPFVRRGAGTCLAKTYAAWLKKDEQVSMNSVAASATLSSAGAAVAGELPTRTTRIAVDRAGTAYLLYKARTPPEGEVESVSFRVRRSDNCGQSWNALGGPAGVRVHQATTVNSLFTNDFGHLLRSGESVHARAKSSDGWIAVHEATGDVYVAYVSVASNGISRIVMARSTDKGQNWSSADVTDGTVMAAYPEIAVNDDGVVGVMFIEVGGTDSKVSFKHRFAMSVDAGKSWNTATLQTLNPRSLHNDSGIIDELWGDFEGLTAQGTAFYGVFAGESIGRRAKELDPIFFKADVPKR